MTTATTKVGTSSGERFDRTSFAATVIGNALEFFDFGVYAYFAVMIGKTFFPVSSALGQLLLSFAAFAVGSITRPLGAVLIGAYGDRAGRRAALTLTIMTMAGGTLLLAATPSYATIGVLAPISVVIARLLQGFSAGGEVGVATSYLVEVAPPGRRGLYGSLQSGTQAIASFAAALLGYGLSLLLSESALTQWGWRIPFFIGLAIAPVGLYIRKRLPETMDTNVGPRTSARVMRDLLKAEFVRPIVLGAIGIIGPTTTTYVLGQYMTSYVLTVLHMPTSIGMLVSVCTGFFAFFAALAGGIASDRVGRRWVMTAPRAILIVAVVPTFGFVISSRSIAVLLVGMSALMILHATSTTALIVALPEAFPRKVRSLAVGFVYSISVAIFGGTTPAVATWLVSVTKSPMAPAWYLVVTNVVSLLAVAFLVGPPPHESID